MEVACVIAARMFQSTIVRNFAQTAATAFPSSIFNWNTENHSKFMKLSSYTRISDFGKL
jgi:hypothetical protein